jgi:hypothetical protein
MIVRVQSSVSELYVSPVDGFLRDADGIPTAMKMREFLKRGSRSEPGPRKG